MSNQIRHINTSILSDAECKSIAHAVAPLLKECLTDEVMTLKEAAAFLKYSPNRVNLFVKKGLIRAHRIDGGDPRFVKSELLEDLINQI